MALTYNTHSDGGFDVLVSTVVSQQFHQHVCAETLTRLTQVFARVSDAHFALTLCTQRDATTRVVTRVLVRPSNGLHISSNTCNS